MGIVLSARAESITTRTFGAIYVAIVSLAALVGLFALALMPLRAGWIGLVFALVAALTYFAQMVLTLIVWDARSFRPGRASSPLSRALRKHQRTMARRTKVYGGLVLACGVLFLVLRVVLRADGDSEASWGGLAMALWGCFAGASALPVSVRRS